MSTSRSAVAEATRARIIDVASRLLADGGRDAVSTRAVSAAAGVQAPTIYRIFGDKQGLLDSVAVHGYLAYLRENIGLVPGSDPVDDIRSGWDVHIDFGLEHPHVYSLIYGQPQPGATSPAVAAAADVIRSLMQRIAEAGRLRVSVDLAVLIANAAGCGTVLTLIGLPEGQRDRALSHEAREAMIGAIITDSPTPIDAGPVVAAVALKALLPQSTGLTVREAELMREWLDRIAGAPNR